MGGGGRFRGEGKRTRGALFLSPPSTCFQALLKCHHPGAFPGPRLRHPHRPQTGTLSPAFLPLLCMPRTRTVSGVTCAPGVSPTIL